MHTPITRMHRHISAKLQMHTHTYTYILHMHMHMHMHMRVQALVVSGRRERSPGQLTRILNDLGPLRSSNLTLATYAHA